MIEIEEIMIKDKEANRKRRGSPEKIKKSRSKSPVKYKKH